MSSAQAIIVRIRAATGAGTTLSAADQATALSYAVQISDALAPPPGASPTRWWGRQYLPLGGSESVDEVLVRGNAIWGATAASPIVLSAVPPSWAALTGYPTAGLIVPSPANGYAYIPGFPPGTAAPSDAIAPGGVTGSSPPTWPTTIGATTAVDGTITWRCYIALPPPTLPANGQQVYVSPLPGFSGADGPWYAQVSTAAGTTTFSLWGAYDPVAGFSSPSSGSGIYSGAGGFWLPWAPSVSSGLMFDPTTNTQSNVGNTLAICPMNVSDPNYAQHLADWQSMTAVAPYDPTTVSSIVTTAGAWLTSKGY
jgi:hypothetical protein